MKAWSQPEMEELNVRATAYSPKGGLIEDGVYQSDDGKYTIPTYGPSSGNSGRICRKDGSIKWKCCRKGRNASEVWGEDSRRIKNLREI